MATDQGLSERAWGWAVISEIQAKVSGRLNADKMEGLMGKPEGPV